LYQLKKFISMPQKKAIGIYGQKTLCFNYFLPL